MNSTTLETVGSELNYYEDYTFPTLYTFAPYIDGETIIADPFEVWGFYRDGSQVNGKYRACLRREQLLTSTCFHPKIKSFIFVSSNQFCDWKQNSEQESVLQTSLSESCNQKLKQSFPNLIVTTGLSLPT